MQNRAEPGSHGGIPVHSLLGKAGQVKALLEQSER
jgi:hypothetical protein